MSDPDHEEQLDEARSLLENVALLETVAAEREAKVTEILENLSEEGIPAGEIARRMDISEQSAEALIEREEPAAPHERAGISEETIERLAPLRVPPSATGSAG